MRTKERYFWVIVSSLLSIALFFPFQRVKALSEISEKYLRVFHEVVTLIQSVYIDPPSEKAILIGAIRGAIASVGDPHSRFLNEEETREFREESRGSFGGLGIEVTYSEGALLVISPIDDTPAMRAGILPQDKIIEISGKNTDKLSLTEAIKMMRGNVGTSISIKILRKGIREPISVSLVRELIKIEYLKSAFLEKENIGYIRLSQFLGESTAKEFEKLVLDFTKRSVKGIIIDLRMNPGGFLDHAVKMSDLFLKPDMDIVSVKGKGGALIKVFKSTSQPEKALNVPVAILINGGSASASEILSGALQDHKRAKIIGQQSFGKGSVQEYYEISYKTMIALTTQKYYTPSGVSIHGKGITPDIVMNPITPDEDERFYLDRVIKQNMLKDFVKQNPEYSEKNVKLFKETIKKKGYTLGDKVIRLILKREYNFGQKAPLYDIELDSQLQKALEVLTSS